MRKKNLIVQLMLCLVILVGSLLLNNLVNEQKAEIEVLLKRLQSFEELNQAKNDIIHSLTERLAAQPNTWFSDTFILTAYDDCTECQGEWVGTTSTGVTPTSGRTIAVDPSVIPYGSLVIIDDHVYVAEDTGGAIVGNRIDVFVESHAAALQFGRQTREVIVLLL